MVQLWHAGCAPSDAHIRAPITHQRPHD